MFLMHIFHRKDMHSAFVSRDGIDPFQSIACVPGVTLWRKAKK